MNINKVVMTTAFAARTINKPSDGQYRKETTDLNFSSWSLGNYPERS